MPSESQSDSMEAAGLQHQLQDAAAGLPDADMEGAGTPDDAEPDEAVPGVVPGLAKGAKGDQHGSMRMVRAMHRRNLVGLLSRALQEGDYMTGAGAAGALLKALPRGSERVKESAPVGGRNVVRMVHVMWGTVEVLIQNMAPAEQVKKVLIRMADLFKQTQSLKRAAHVELLMHTWKHSTPADVQALISQPETATYLAGAGSMGPFAYHVAWISALIQHRAWFQQVLALHASNTHSQQQHLSTAGLLGPLQLSFAPLSSLVNQEGRVQDGSGSQPGLTAGAAGGSDTPAGGGGESGLDGAVGDAALNLEVALKKVLSISPGASQPALLMCHMLVLSGRQADAAQVATAAAAASGMSPESLSLWALLTEPRMLAAVAAVAAAMAADATNAAGDGDAADAQAYDADVEMEADDDGDADVDPVHSFVTVCEEILSTDPWALGALEGLLQTTSHCHNCTAAAIRGLMCHMDAALTEAAAGDMHTCAACDTSSAATASSVSVCLHLQQRLCHWWVVLAGLLVQLATAAVAADQPASGGPAQPQTQRQLPRAQQQQQQRQRHGNRDSNSSEEAEEEAAEEAAADAVGAVQCPWALWQQLQQQWFAARQRWWPLAGLCQPQEVTLLTHLVRQLQQQHAQHPQQQQQQPDNQHPEGTPQQQQQQHTVSQPTGPATGNGLLGSAGGRSDWGGGVSGGSLGAGASGGQRMLPSQYHMPSTQQRQRQLSDTDRGSDSQQESEEDAEPVDQQQQQQQGVDGRGVGDVCVDDVLCQTGTMLCSKAVALAFMLGPSNSYSTAAAAAFAATAAQPATAAAVPVQSQSQTGGVDNFAGSLFLAADEARVALQDALQLARQLQDRLVQQQQHQRQLQQQQQQQQQPNRHFGVPTAEFGALLDMPDAWWAAFPHKRRMTRQQQQQQPQQGSEDADMG